MQNSIANPKNRVTNSCQLFTETQYIMTQLITYVTKLQLSPFHDVI